jgi:hypothetical protein
VVEPTMNGIGSDAFCILWDGTKLVGMNASGHSPELMTPDKYEGQAKIADTGWGCVSTRERYRCGWPFIRATASCRSRPVRAGDQVRP